MKSLLEIVKYLVVIVALSAIPFVSRMSELRAFGGMHSWTPTALQTQQWFTSQISSGEKILWCSGVSPDYKVDEAMPTAFAGVAVALTGLLVIGLLSMAKLAGSNSSLSVFAWIMIIGGASLSTAPYWACGHALHSACVLTDTRAINIYETGGCDSISYNSNYLARPFVLSGSGERQTLLFYWDYLINRRSQSRMQRRKTGFLGISDGAAALKILEERTE